MNILLIQPSETDKAMINLGLGYIAAALEARGDNVKILDAGILGGSEKRFIRFAEEFGPDLVGITAQTPYYSKALKMSKLIKNLDRRCPVILGGPHPSILTEETLREASIDIVVRGEGDITVVELVGCLESGADLDAVKGISYKQDGKIVHNETRTFIKDLDALPNPAWHLFDMRRYLARMKGRKVAPVLSSRGCPFKCIFCYRGPAAGKTFRGRSPERILDEIEHLHMEYGIRDILFVDDIFTINQKRAEVICDLLIEKGLDITWRCQTRADCLSIELLRKMKQANCMDVSMGVESGNEAILKATGKQVTKEKVRKAFKMTKEVGISTSASFIIGLPGDTKETVRQTIEFAKELNPNFAIFYAAIPYPGTELARIVEERGGKLPENWDDYRLMSSDAASSKKLADLNISELNEKELRHFLKIAQVEFQAGRIFAGGASSVTGMINILQVMRLSFTRARSLKDIFRFMTRVLSNGFLFLWGKLARR